MKTRIILFILGFLSLLTVDSIVAQDKDPVAVDDYYQIAALQEVELKVTENDYAYENHPFRIFTIIGNPAGDITFNDSVIHYSASMYFGGTDSLKYRIIDLENNLMSDFATVYIEVLNNGYDTLDINRIHCRLNSWGNHFWNNYGSYSFFEAPANSGIMSLWNQSFWIGGTDEAGQLHLAAERYRINGKDFFPGPVMDSTAYSYELDIEWNRVWKINFSDIRYHQQHWNDPGYEPVKGIAEWPGNGNTSMGQAAQLAPYCDHNADGIYNPLDGDCPLIKGDQAIYIIMNDHRDEHVESGGEKLGIEIHAMYYAYDRPADSALVYTVFADYKIINRSQQNYTDVYAAHYLDYDIGYAWDDYIGCDTSLHAAFAYNGSPTDGYGGAGSYGDHPGAQAFTYLNTELSGFTYFTNVIPNPAMNDPQHAHEYLNYMKGMWKDSTHFTYGGNGYQTGEPTKYAFSGDPVTGEGWTETSAENEPGDRRGVCSTGPFELNAGDTLQYEFALVFARDYQGDQLSSAARVRDYISDVRAFYENSVGINEMQTQPIEVEIYPNPFDRFIMISSEADQKNMQYLVVDILGEKIAQGKISSGKTLIDLSSLKNGLYFIRLTDGQRTMTKKIIKS